MQTAKVAADRDRVIKFLFYIFRDYNKINQGRERARKVRNARLKSQDRD